MATDFRDAAQAAKAVCDMVSSLPAQTAAAIQDRFQEAAARMPLTLSRGPREKIEPVIVRALELTMSATIVQMNGVPYLKCWQVDSAEAMQGASVLTIFGLPEGKELALALLVWRGDDGLLYAAVNSSLAPAILSPSEGPKKAGCLGALLLAAAGVLDLVRGS